MMKKYSIGIDYGTLSGRALMVDIHTGEEIATCAVDYPHGVMDAQLPCGKKLGVDWALQDPQDYLDVLYRIIPNVINQSRVSPSEIIGIGVDFTCCTVMPVLKDGTPLCSLKKYKCEPNAYVKLWKHHAAQDKANRLTEIAEKRGEPWLKGYGGRISSEWVIPKLWQVLDESPEIYDAMDRFIEAGDWLVWQLTGNEKRNSCSAGYKALWSRKNGYPSDEFFAALDPRLRNVVDEKLSREIFPLGSRAGGITDEIAQKTGLAKGTPVAVSNVDAHVCVPAVKIDGPAKMLAIMGTSTCHMLMTAKEHPVSGVCGCVQDGILPGYFGYEAGQSCVGDHFAWFTKNCAPKQYYEKAEKKGVSIHEYMQEKAKALKAGESGLLALDWWNGNRSVLQDADLTGVIVGMTLMTKPEEIYRALVEATAFGTRKIIENFEENGEPIDEFYASGGIAEKSPFVMQLYADIINKPVRISGSAQGPALGAAIFGAVVAGSENGGYDDVGDAIRAMGKLKDIEYRPNKDNAVIYDEVYAEYLKLHDYFGRGRNNVMKNLKELKK